jgi:L-ascorbate metabolism protein UlaG (beta-lactamase superfamily)
MPDVDRIRFIGHATVELRLSGITLLTDPFLRDRVGPLVRRPPSVDAASLLPDAVLISHLDRDHMDLPSLRRLAREPSLVVPRGGEAFARSHGFEVVTELAVGETTEVGEVQVTAVPAVHDGRRAPYGPTAETVGYLVAGSSRVYFAGDTDLFDGMSELSPGLDLALLPIAGWGPTLGEGHLDPERAARALQLLRPRLAVPIHWGTLHPIGLAHLMSHQLTDSPHEFARFAALLAPEVQVRVLVPGDSLPLGESPASGDDSAERRRQSRADG